MRLSHALVARERQCRQGILAPVVRTPEQAVGWSGAVQAQEYAAARWGLGLRLPDTVSDADVERAFDEGRILRTHVMRPTWHFVSPADIRWMLALTGPRVDRRMLPYRRQLDLDGAALAKSTRVLERALGDGRFLPRTELAARLTRAGIVEAKGVRLAHILLHAELAGVICSGPRRNGQFTYALLGERVPATPARTDDDAAGELARRYFRSHGPATIRDFVWWSGLSVGQARRGLEIIRATSREIEGLTYWTVDSSPAPPSTTRRLELLPVYDEYLIAYRDRTAVPHGPPRASRSPLPVTFQHAIIRDGQVAGTWRIRRSAAVITMKVGTFNPLSRADQRGLQAAAERYGRFVGSPVVVEQLTS